MKSGRLPVRLVMALKKNEKQLKVVTNFHRLKAIQSSADGGIVTPSSSLLHIYLFFHYSFIFERMNYHDAKYVLILIAHIDSSESDFKGCRIHSPNLDHLNAKKRTKMYARSLHCEELLIAIVFFSILSMNEYFEKVLNKLILTFREALRTRSSITALLLLLSKFKERFETYFNSVG